MSLLLCYSRMTKTPLTATIRKCTLKDHIHPELRDKLILGISGARASDLPLLRSLAKGWQQDAVQKEQHIAQRSKTLAGMILAAAVRARNIV
jgi:hypothetical protein